MSSLVLLLWSLACCVALDCIVSATTNPPAWILLVVSVAALGPWVVYIWRSH